MNTYLGIVTEDGVVRHASMIVAPDALSAEKLLAQAWPSVRSPVATKYTALPSSTEEAQTMLKRLAGNVQLGYPLIHQPQRRITLTLDVDSGLTDADIRKLFKPGAVVDIEELKV